MIAVLLFVKKRKMNEVSEIYLQYFILYCGKIKIENIKIIPQYIASEWWSAVKPDSPRTEDHAFNCSNETEGGYRFNFCRIIFQNKLPFEKILDFITINSRNKKNEYKI